MGVHCCGEVRGVKGNSLACFQLLGEEITLSRVYGPQLTSIYCGCDEAQGCGQKASTVRSKHAGVCLETVLWF